MSPNISRFLSTSKEIGLVAAPFRGGQLKDGVQFGPREFYRAGLITHLTDLGFTIHGNAHQENYAELRPFVGDDRPYRGMWNPRLVSTTTRSIAAKVYEHAQAGRTVITLGGDHSIGIGSVGGMARAMSEQGTNLAVVWIDAHADINTPEASLSGNIHGMPLAFLTGLATSGQEGIFEWLNESHTISFDNLVYIGLRDVDESEERTIETKGIKAFPAQHVKERGVNEVLKSTLAHIGPNKPIHLVFDIDALDPAFAPSTGMAVEGGLSLTEVCVIAMGLFESGQIVGIDLVEVNPRVSPEGSNRTVQSGFSLLRTALGDVLRPWE